MKYVVNQFMFIMIILTSLSCASNRNMSESDAVITTLSGKTSIPDGSLIYSLPLTVLDIIVETERVIERPGPYARYAEDLLGLRDVIKSESELWTITGVIIKSHEEPDPSELYVIEANEIFHSNALSLKKAGLILDINPDIFNETADIVSHADIDLNRTQISDLGADEYFQSRSDTVYKLVSFDTAFVRVPYLVEKKQKLTLAALAEKAAVRLMEMRDGKHLILTGEANVFPQDQSSIAEMNRLEKEYTELFTGKIWKGTQRFSFQIIPGRELKGQKLTVCTFSEATGPAASSDKPGAPLEIEFLTEPKGKGVTVITTKQSDSSKPRYDKLYYRVPEVVNLKISLGDEVYKSSRRLIYQFGEVILLPSNYIIGK